MKQLFVVAKELRKANVKQSSSEQVLAVSLSSSCRQCVCVTVADVDTLQDGEVSRHVTFCKVKFQQIELNTN